MFRPLALLAVLCACSNTVAPRCETAIAFDDFDRADAEGLGIAPSGQAWMVSGPGYLAARVESGRFTAGPPDADNTTYAAIVTSQKPVRLGGRFSFVTGPGGVPTPIALISSSDESLTLGHMVHLIVQPTGWRLTTWSETGQDRPLAVEPATAQTFPVPLRADGTVYEVWMTIRGDLVQLELPEGRTAEYRDPLVPALAGRQTIWELPYDAASASVPRWESVAVFGASCGGV